MAEAIGIDIGGSSVKSARVDCTAGELISNVSIVELAADRTPEDLLAILKTIILTYPSDLPVGVGFPGVVRQGHTRPADHLGRGWDNFDFLSALQSLAKVPVALLNDADAAGLAEMQFGAGQRENHPDGAAVLMITLGTGIGTALFHRGRLYPNLELGHIELDGADAELAAAASARTQENLDWPEWGTRVNHYLQAMERLVSPQLIIIGGGVSQNFSHFSPFLDTEAEPLPAHFGNAAGIVGAALAVSHLPI